MKIAFFGANSYIAKDLIRSFSDNQHIELDLFVRSPESMCVWLKQNNHPNKYNALTYDKFSKKNRYDGIINFIGVGNPAQAMGMGDLIFEITRYYDQMILEYLDEYTDTKYIFLSSGAIYGSQFIDPATISTPVSIDMNECLYNDWYGKSKLYAEIGHRHKVDLNIVDLRIFNYFSSTIDVSARYFITDILRSISTKQIFKTKNENITRDYLCAEDLYHLVQCIFSAKQINTALDCFTKAPIDKFSILENMKEKFGLSYEFDNSICAPTLNFKKNYYSLNKKASDFGYYPSKTSIACLLDEAEVLLGEY